jgi:hypothetical protein
MTRPEAVMACISYLTHATAPVITVDAGRHL